MPAAVYNITIEQGVKFELGITYKDEEGSLVDLTGYTACMDIREKYSDTTVIKTLTDISGITLGGAAGTIDILISAVDTRAFTFKKGVYDLELYPAAALSDTVRLMQGMVTLSKEATRSND